MGRPRSFSSAKAIGIPDMEQMPPQIPIEVDPPEHRYFRLPINIGVSPKAVQVFSGFEARELAIELIEGFQVARRVRIRRVPLPVPRPSPSSCAWLFSAPGGQALVAEP